MPLTGANSYPPTMQEVIAHWTPVNASLGATPLLLKSAYSLTNFTADRTAIVNAIIALEPFNNTLQQALSDRDIKKAAIKPRTAQFRNAVRYFLQATPYENALATQPQLDTNESKFLQPLDDMAALWATLNALPATGAGSIPGFTPPLVLFGAYNLAAFTTELATMRAAFLAVTNARKAAEIARGKRDILLAPAKARMLQYRRAILALYPPTDPFVTSLPVLSVNSTATPAPVSVSGVWDSFNQVARLTIIPSDNPKLDHYDVRVSPDDPYKAASETTIGTIKKEDTTFEFTQGLTSTGSTVRARVYVVLTTGNEKGSATVKIVRS